MRPPNPFNMSKALKQVQKFQEDLARLQEELAERTVEAGAGGGAVVAVADGSGKLREVRIDPAAVDPNDVTMLQDMVVAAVNEALRQAREMSEREMAALTAGLGLPGLPGLPGGGLPPGMR